MGGINPDAYKFAKERQELFEYAQDNLRKVGKHMKKYANMKWRLLEFVEKDSCGVCGSWQGVIKIDSLDLEKDSWEK